MVTVWKVGKRWEEIWRSVYFKWLVISVGGARVECRSDYVSLMVWDIGNRKEFDDRKSESMSWGGSDMRIRWVSGM